MKNKRHQLYIDLYTTFFRIGILTFGGGLTMLPMLKHEVVHKKNWTSEEELLDCYAIGQCTPGIIAVNTATYIGYKKAGVKGGVIATLGMISPSLVIITLVAAFLKQFMDNVWLQHALVGVRGIICALMLHTVINLAKKSFVHPICVGLCLVVFGLAMLTEIPTIILVVAAAVCGNFLAGFTSAFGATNKDADDGKASEIAGGKRHD